jgi:hypothetical protein
MKKGSIRTKIVGGQKLSLSFLGKGQFTECWHDTKTGHVYQWSVDVVKDCIEKWADQDNKHVPVQERIDYLDDGRLLFKAKFYRPLMARHKTAWKQFRILEAAREEAVKQLYTMNNVGHYGDMSYRQFWTSRGHQVASLTIDLVRDELPEELIDALESIYGAASSAGSGMTFEFAKRNLAIDEEENLILLDIAFDSDKAGA